MTTISLTFNNTTTELTSDTDGMFNLNVLHHASGFGKHKMPNKWRENTSTRELIARYSQTPNSGLAVRRGGNNPGTWAIEQIVYAYASWISPAFHAAVLEAFLHAVHGDGNAAVESAQRVARLEGKDTRAAEVAAVAEFEGVVGGD